MQKYIDNISNKNKFDLIEFGSAKEVLHKLKN
jgi:hypothetical protein